MAKAYYNPQKNNPPTELFSSPYNFVSFSDRVYEYGEHQLIKHNDISKETYSGEITYEIEAKTPICIDDGKSHFHKNVEGKYSIPGSTMRGLIRNNVQVLGLSSYYDDIDDYALMYRHVAAGANKDLYNKTLGAGTTSIMVGKKSANVSVLKKVKAGYIKKEHGKYFIYKTCLDQIDTSFGEMNYYLLSEKKIINDYLNAQKYRSKFQYSYFVKNGQSKMQHNLKPFVEKEEKGKKKYIGEPNRDYKPYIEEISYELEGQRTVSAVGKSGIYSKKGYVVSSGVMREKKVIYIIPEIDYKKEAIPVSPKDVDAFLIDFKKRKNVLKPQSFFALPEREDEIKPVFYIEDKVQGRLYFGFTPRLRLFCNYTIKAGLKKVHKADIVDYNKAMFGSEEFKSKVSFSDAVLQNNKQPLATESIILAEPKPTSYLDYLTQGKQVATYNSEKFELRGVKQYWLHKGTIPGNVDPKQVRLASKLEPLPQGSLFEGKIRFKNLSKDELGLLLWSVQLNKKSWMNVGKAKSYGYGAISVKIKSAKRFNQEKAYTFAGGLQLNPFDNIDISSMIACYKRTINQFLKNQSIDELRSVKEFFAMKDSSKIPENQKTSYTPLKLYASRKSGVPQVSKVISLD